MGVQTNVDFRVRAPQISVFGVGGSCDEPPPPCCSLEFGGYCGPKDPEFGVGVTFPLPRFVCGIAPRETWLFHHVIG